MTELVNTINAIKADHPETCDAARAMMDAAILHQRIADLELERDSAITKQRQFMDERIAASAHSNRVCDEIRAIEQERNAWRSMATRLGNVIAKSSFDLSEEEQEALAELKELQDKP